MAGEKLIIPNKVAGDALQALGGSPLSVPLTDMYPAIQRGTADGTMIAWVAFNPWKLYEVTSYHVDTAFGGAAGMIFMSRAKYNALPPAAKKIIDENSGEALSRNFGKVMAGENEVQRQSVMKMPKQTFVTPTAVQLAGWQQKVTPVIEQWTKVVPDGTRVSGAIQDRARQRQSRPLTLSERRNSDKSAGLSPRFSIGAICPSRARTIEEPHRRSVVHWGQASWGKRCVSSGDRLDNDAQRVHTLVGAGAGSVSE